MNIYIRIVLILLLCFSCSNGPDKATLQGEVTVKLNTHFKNNLFSIESFSRRGSYGYTPIGKTDKELLLYYKARLTLNQDYKFTDWDSLSVGSLTHILGSTPSGIEGIISEGNKKGDIITVYGTSNYKKDKANEWIASAPTITKKKAGSQKSKKYVSEIDESKKYDQDLPEYKKSLKILNQIFTTMSAERDSQTMKDAEQELKQVLHKANMYADIRSGITTIATGSQAGNYYSIGNGIAAINDNKPKIKAYFTSGSVENCGLTQDKKVSFSIVQSNVAFMAYRGLEIFKDSIPMSDLRAVGAMFPEAIMIITRKDSSFKTIYDLKGKVITIGLQGSGGHTDAMELIRAHKLRPSFFSEIKEISFDSSIDALKNRKVDAIFMTGAYPMTSLGQLNEVTPISILSIDSEMITKMTKRFPLIKIRIPKKTYKGQTNDVLTVGTTAMMVTHKDNSNESVKKMLHNMINKNSELRKKNIHASYITRRSLQRGITIPMHEGATQYIKEN